MLSLDGVEERPHFERQAFRTKRRTFATLGGGTVNILIEPADKRDGLMESFPDTFLSLGNWTKAFGHVGVVLKTVDDQLLIDLVTESYKASLPVPRKRKKK
jgi:hypothetical protein